mgnify:CR=1 FL=1
MNTPALSSETVHTSCIAIGGRAVLIGGRSGRGKSDLALRLIDRGASLVSDDYTVVHRRDGRPVASAPDTIAGKIEVRGVGLSGKDARLITVEKVTRTKKDPDSRIEQVVDLGFVGEPKVIDTTHESFVFELTGSASKIDAFIELMRPLGLVDVSRTGAVAIARGPEPM